MIMLWCIDALMRRCRAAGIKKFAKGKVVKASRAYNGVTGQQLTAPLSVDFCARYHIVWAGKKEWKGAERIAADFAAAAEEEAVAAMHAESTEDKSTRCVDWVDSGEPVPEEVVRAAGSVRNEGVVLCWKDNEKNG